MCRVPVPVAYHSFGGWKRSIFSDIGMYGAEAIRFYTKLKTVTQRWFPGRYSMKTIGFIGLGHMGHPMAA